MQVLTGMIFPWSAPYEPTLNGFEFKFCHGQELQINDYMNLFTVIGSTFGGNGASTFRLPDLRIRVPIGAGQAVDSPKVYKIGQSGGEQQARIGKSEMPQHTHKVNFPARVSGNIDAPLQNGTCSVSVQLPDNATNQPGNLVPSPTANTTLGVAQTANGIPINMYTTNQPNTRLRNGSVTAAGTATGAVTGQFDGMTGTLNLKPTGANEAFSIEQPYLTINYIICVNGLFPERQTNTD